MHDPLTQVFSIRIPRLTPYKHAWNLRSRWLRSVATIWHQDPSNYDDTTCKVTDHWKHVHHWRVQLDTWQTFRRRWLDRCAWCGKGSTKGDPVNISHTWDAPDRPWWRHTDCFHSECSAIETASRACVCDVPYLDIRGYGECMGCGKFRSWRPTTPTLEANRILASIPAGQRDANKYAQVKKIWREYDAAVGGHA